MTVELRELKPKRDMRVIKGPLNELISVDVYGGTNVEDYIYAILTDENELIDPISKLRTVYPNIMGLSRESIVNKEESRTSASKGYQNKSKLDIFDEFYYSMSGKRLDRKRYGILKNVIEEVEKEGI